MSRITSHLLDLYRFGQSQGNEMYDTGLGRLSQAIQFDAAMAERRRQALEQERNQRKQINEEKKARKKAERDSMIRMGIGAGSAIAGGALIGSAAAGAPAVAPAATIADSGVAASQAPNLTTAASMSAITNPESVALMPGSGEMVQSAVSGAPAINPSGSVLSAANPTFNPSTYDAATMPLRSTAPAAAPVFANGSRAGGAALGAGLGLASFASGNDFLTPAINMPYRNAMNSARLYDQGIRSALTGERIATERAMRNPSVKTELARGGAYDALRKSRDADTATKEELRPWEVATEANRGESYGALTDQRNASAAASDELAETRRQTRPLSLSDWMERTKRTKAQTRKIESDITGGKAFSNSAGFKETSKRLDDMAARGASDDEMRKFIKYQLDQKVISAAEHSYYKRELFRE